MKEECRRRLRLSPHPIGVRKGGREERGKVLATLTRSTLAHPHAFSDHVKYCGNSSRHGIQKIKIHDSLEWQEYCDRRQDVAQEMEVN